MLETDLHLLCIGLGYTARVLAKRLTGQGWLISGTARSEDGVKSIEAAAWQGLGLDGVSASPGVRGALALATHLLLSAPPEAAGDPVLRLYGADIADGPSLRWIGYLSTVGVYGDTGGGWVDEALPANPGTERGKRRLAAEAAWLALGRDSGKRVHVFRLPGIYGPGRSAIDNLRAGTARRIIKPGQVFNRIHVDDIATALIAAMTGPTPLQHQIYNITDDEPCRPEDVVTFAAGLIGVPPPPAIAFEDADLSPMARSFYGESKRVSNARMKHDLGISLAYPTYRQGLQAIVAAQS